MSLYFIPRNRDRHPPISNEELMTLDALTSKMGMIEKLSSMLELPVEEYKVRETVSAELNEIFKKYYPECLLAMFGSSINGFGVKNSDLDLLFLPFPDYNVTGQTQTEKLPAPNPESILSGETPRDALHKLDDWRHFKFLKLLLKKEANVRNCNLVPGKSPALKVFLRKPRIICDLHINNKIVIFNSELLQFLEKVDPRIKPLVLTLCFWARSLGFLKSSSVVPRYLSNYAFILLVIFFLQNTSPPILPPIKHLIDNAGFSRMSAGWQTAFATDMRLIHKSKNTKSIVELMLEFFEFYWNFDFVQNIVSPYAGKILPVKVVKDSTVEAINDFELSAINIQDPFVLSKNVCKIDKDIPTLVFKFALHTAQQMLQNIPEKYKLRMLFDPEMYQRVFDFNFAKYVSGRPRVCFVNLDYECMSHLSKNAKFSQQLWYERVSQAVYEVLQYGLLIECEVTDKTKWGKNAASAYAKENGMQSKVQGNDANSPNSDISLSDLHLIQSVQCVVYSRTWMGRKKFTEVTVSDEDADEFNSSVLKAEHSVSRELIKKNPVLNRSVPLMCFKCDCYKHACPQINNVVILLKPLTFSREFYQVSSFLASYIPKTVKKILLTY